MEHPWTLVIEDVTFGELTGHLFRDDYDEHGAVIAAGIATTDRGTRLLARELFLARDGVDFVPGKRGYRMLTPQFVRDRIAYCRDNNLIYLAIHNHGGTDAVGFSPTDLASHERGYPALLDIGGRPVGALVLAINAVAGDIWTPDRRRRELIQTIVVGTNLRRLHPVPPPPPPEADHTYDRQARWFGDRGQHLLGQLKVGVIGAGGVGLPLATMLARLGVGTLVVIDPDRVDQTNLPRLDATRLDALVAFRRLGALGERVANRLSTRKTRLARRAARRANPDIQFIGIPKNVIEPDAAAQLVDCDFLFLAADSHQARMVFNAVVHQYLVPGIQLGTRIDVDRNTGNVGDIRTNIRIVLPRSGCLRCNKLISASKLQDESLGLRERERNRYIDDVPAPSVITFNTFAAAQAANDFLLMIGELLSDDAPIDYLRSRPQQRKLEPVVPLPSRADCRDCGTDHRSRRGRGDTVDLPLPQRA
jgi:molybdopterin/thiamine biosynthesis adenylyltransferase